MTRAMTHDDDPPSTSSAARGRLAVSDSSRRCEGSQPSVTRVTTRHMAKLSPTVVFESHLEHGEQEVEREEAAEPVTIQEIGCHVCMSCLHANIPPTRVWNRRGVSCYPLGRRSRFALVWSLKTPIPKS